MALKCFVRRSLKVVLQLCFWTDKLTRRCSIVHTIHNNKTLNCPDIKTEGNVKKLQVDFNWSLLRFKCSHSPFVIEELFKKTKIKASIKLRSSRSLACLTFIVWHIILT